jgi:hypothetical protein
MNIIFSIIREALSFCPIFVRESMKRTVALIAFCCLSVRGRA